MHLRTHSVPIHAVGWQGFLRFPLCRVRIICIDVVLSTGIVAPPSPTWAANTPSPSSSTQMTNPSFLSTLPLLTSSSSFSPLFLSSLPLLTSSSSSSPPFLYSFPLLLSSSPFLFSSFSSLSPFLSTSTSFSFSICS
ncbi:hypothetical protein Pmani_027115 [Petrolisthes manimaculis]|uniref:Uncharacterized protein n=1 Tax=Petrolisthes manimaculis TaxID=1843537 RepID=A0AAE1P2A9_9EUCA|nr:hypothetical protein Pmani_027115 [Petrolisthes manimaculis]